MKLVSIRLDEKTVDRLDDIARRTLMSRSEIIRNSIAIYLTLLENIGFYFKPSLPVKNIDVYEERNAVNVDLGNLTSVTVLNVSYGGVGELEMDVKKDLGFVAEVLANQVAVETYCRFVSPLLVTLSTTCGFDYTRRFFRELSKVIRKKLNVRTILSGYEEFFETNQSGFVCTVVGLRDMMVRNSPKRGDKIFFYGRDSGGEDLKSDDLLDVKKVLELSNLVREGIATSIFSVKSGGLNEVANLIASLAGGKPHILGERMGCPATAVVLTSDNNLEEFGCEYVGEIL